MTTGRHTVTARLPKRPSLDDIRHHLTWRGMVDQLDEGQQSIDDQLMLAVLQLEVFGDEEQALSTLAARSDDPLARWLLFQIAALGSDDSPMADWLEAESRALESDDAARLRSEVELLRELGRGLQSAGDTLVKRRGAGPAETLARELMLVVTDNWSALVSAVDRRDPVGALVSAHALGDHLGDVDGQLERLQQLGDSAPLFAAEVMLERAFGEDDDGAALREVFGPLTRALEGAQLGAQLEAIRLYRVLRGGDAGGAVKSLSDEKAAAAWRYLALLVTRQSAGSDRKAIIAAYLDLATEVPLALGNVLRLRAAEAMMASGDWRGALTVLPTGSDVSDVLERLADRYRIYCQAKLGGWSAIGQALVEAEPGSARGLELAVALGSRQPEAAAPLLEHVRGRLPSDAHLGDARVHAMVLSFTRRLGDRARLAGEWLAVGEKLLDGRAAALCAFAGGTLLLEVGQADRALVAFNMAERHLPDSSLLAAGRTVAAVGVGEWARGAAALGELAARSGSAGNKMRRAAAQLLWYGGDFNGAAAMLEEVARDDGNGDADGGRAAAQRDGALLCKQLANIHLEQGNVVAAAGALDRAAALLRDGAKTGNVEGASDEAAELFYDVGMLLLGERAEAERAESSLRDALALDPLHHGALDGLRELLARAERWAELLSVLSSLIALTNEDQDRLQLHLEYASVSRRLLVRAGLEEGVAAAGVEHCDHALAIDPENARAVDNLIYICSKLKWWDRLAQREEVLSRSAAGLRGLRRTFEALDDYESLARVCRAIAEKTPVRREAAAAAMQAGDIHLRQMNDAASAEWYYRRAAELDADNVQPLRRLANVLRELEQWQSLVEVLEQLIARAPNDEPMLRLELSALYVESLDQPADAQPHLEQILADKPEHLQALRLLDRVLSSTGGAADRARVLEQLLEHTTDDEQTRGILIELANSYLQLSDERSLARVASNLERFADDSTALAIVERIYRDLGYDRELCDFYGRRIDTLVKRNDAAGAVELLGRKAEREQGTPALASRAVDTLLQLHKLSPHPAVLGQLERMLTDAGDWQRLVSLLEAHAETLDTSDEKVRCLHRAADIARLNLNDEAELVRINERIYYLSPSDSRAFSVLEKKHERTSDHRKLIELLLAQADTVTDTEEELRLIVRAGAISEKLGQVDRAAQLYQRALSMDSASSEALEALSRIYESLERWDDLLKVTRRQIKLGGKKSWVALLHFKCGSIMETQFRDDDAAFRCYMEAIKVSRTCLPALHGLRDLHARHGRWLKVAHTLEAEAAVWAEAKGKADVLAQAAEVHATKLGDQEKAFEFYERAIKVNPECMPAALALFEYNADLGRFEEAAQWGQVCARRKSRWSTEKRARFLVRWGDVLAKLERIGDAAEVFVKALTLRPGEPRALYGLLALCRADADAYDFTTAFRDLLDDARERDDTVAAAILASSAGVLAEQRGNVDEALALYRQAVRIVGEQVQVVLPLADLLVRIGEGDEACQLVARCATDDEDFERWLEAMLWLARNYGLDRGDHGRAIATYEEILSKQPNLDEVRVELASIHSLAGNYDRACKLLESAASQLASRGGGDVKKLAKRYHALGIAWFKSGNYKAAESNWRRACALHEDWPYPYLTLSRLKEVQHELNDAERELKLAEQGLDVKNADVMRLQAEYYARNGHVGRAITLYRKAVGLADPLINDRVNQARYMLRTEEAQQAIDVLRKTARKRPDYVPTFEQLGNAYLALGEPKAANRAMQVVYVATGSEVVGGGAQPAPRALSAGGLLPLKELLDAHPLSQIWSLLDPSVRGAMLVAPDTVPIERDDLVRVAGEMSQLFGVEAGIALAPTQREPVALYGTFMLFSSEAAQLPAADLRALMAYALSGLAFGVGELIGLAAAQRDQMQGLLGELLGPERQWSDEAGALVSGVTGRARRQLLKKLGEIAPQQQGMPSWGELVDDLCVRSALLVLSDFGAVTRLLGMRAGIQARWAAEGGLLHTLPEVQQYALYFISDEFSQVRERLVIGG